MNDSDEQVGSAKSEKLNAWGRAYESLRTALGFLTQIPVGSDVRFDDDCIRYSILFYPSS